jgi:DNA-binding transcriptional LysR family regulator
MVELRALAYFVTACRFDRLARAAATLGIAPSTLSTTLKTLEEELGLALFRRIDAGLYPTADARWLMRVAEPLLIGETFARRWTIMPQPRPARLLTVEIGLSFAIGRVGAAIQRAIATMAAERPEILVDPIWTEESDARRVDGIGDAWPGITRNRLILGIADTGGADKARAVTLLRDDWVFAVRLPAGTHRLPTARDLAAGRLIVPALAPPLLKQVERYFRRRKMGGVRFVNDHPAELPRLIDEYPDAALFVPESLIAPRLGMARVGTVTSEPRLTTRIVVRSPAPDVVTALFIRHLTAALRGPWRASLYRPLISLRQIHYFNLVHRLRRVSAAAHGANVSQPALSEQLRKLEGTLRVALFERRGDGVIPTAAGDRFAGVARPIETGHRRIAEGSIVAAPQGRIAFGILPSVSQHGLLVNCITEAMLSVQSRHPGIKLEFREAPNGTLQDWVVRGRVGAAIVETGLAHMPRLPLGSSEGLAAVVHASHGLLPAGAVKFADLLRLPLVLPTSRSGLRLLLEDAAKERGLTIEPHLEIDALTMVAAILARLPVSTVLPPSSVRRELAAGELVAHPIVDPVISRRLFVIYSGERSLSEPERDLVNTLRARLMEPE